MEKRSFAERKKKQVDIKLIGDISDSVSSSRLSTDGQMFLLTTLKLKITFSDH